MHLTLALLTLLVATTSYGDNHATNLSLGAGMLASPRYEGSGAIKVLPIPLINASYAIDDAQTVSWKGLGATYTNQLVPTFALGLQATYTMGRDTDDDYELLGLAEIDDTLTVGPHISYTLNRFLSLNASLATDITGNGHDGTTAEAYLGHRTILTNGAMLASRIGATYASDNYMANTFSVPASTARADRPRYAAKAGLHSLNIGTSLVTPLHGNWSLLANMGADYLLGDAADSPLVEQNLQPKLLLGLSYKFY